MRNDIECRRQAIFTRNIGHQEAMISKMVVDVPDHDVENHAPKDLMRILNCLRVDHSAYFGNSCIAAYENFAM